MNSSDITLFILDENDPIISKYVNGLVPSLKNHLKTQITKISDLNVLSKALESNRDTFIILIGHSDSQGIKINDKTISWEQFSSVLTSFPDKTFIIPTCYSFNVYKSKNVVLSNLVAPFLTLADYRISIDTTLLTLGILTNNHDLLNDALDALINSAIYIKQPKDTLIIHESENLIFEPGKGYLGRINIYDIMAAENSFIMSASVKSGAMLLLWYLLKEIISISTIISFLITLFDWIVNWLSFIVFLFSNNIPTYVKVYDYGTFMDYDHYYDDIGDLRINYYLWFHSLTSFTFYSDTYANPDVGWIQRKYWNVGMEIELLSLLQGVLYDISLGLFSIKSIIWHCFYSGIQNVIPIYSGGGGGKPGIINTPD